MLKRLLVSLLVLLLPILALQPAMVGAATANRGQFAQSVASNDTIEVKFTESAEVVISNDEFVSQAHNTNLAPTNKLLKDKKATNKRPLLNQDVTSVRTKQKQLRAQGVAASDLASYYRVKLQPGQNAKDVANELKQLPGVAQAYAAPTPVIAPTTPSFISLQKYLGAAPQNMGITAAASLPGAIGKNVKVADLEYSWSTTHEDLAKNRLTGALWPVGTPIDYYGDNNHGTAVSGIIGATHNTMGVDGIAYNTDFHMVNTYSAEYGWDIATAIFTASNKMSAGDVMLIEQQTVDANGNYVPVEWIPSVYDAIKSATALGIIVIEPAGNGGVNLDDPMYGTSFPSGKPDSGAIMVGAGSACDGTANHYRLPFSNYGKRVDVQGNGECVMTTGYGNYYGNVSTNDAYISNFNGTSSASAMLAATVANLSSSYEDMYKKPANSALIRFVLAMTGTPQDNTINPGHIGSLPNLTAAIKILDTVNPRTPTNVTVTLNGSNQPVVKWTASTDNASIAKYNIYRNGTLYASVVGTKVTYTDTKIARNTKYGYRVQAVDPLGHVSGKTASVYVTTRR